MSEVKVLNAPAPEVGAHPSFALAPRDITLITELVPEHAIALILACACGMSYRDIAKITECAEGTVKSRLARAREAFRRLAANPVRIARPASILDSWIAANRNFVAPALLEKLAPGIATLRKIAANPSECTSSDEVLLRNLVRQVPRRNGAE